MAGKHGKQRRGHFVTADYHKRLLADRLRVDAFREAIEELVEPGMAVADVGTGTGLLALFARRAGARVVYAIEPAPVIRLARQVAKDNGFDGIHFIEADSLETELPEPVDLVISECMGNFVVTDEMMDVLADLRRHLRPGGRICPARIRMYVAPARILSFREVAWWEDPVEGIDFSALQHAALNRAYVVQGYPDQLIGSPVLLHEMVPLEMDKDHIVCGECELELLEAGPLTGLLGWFDAELSPRTTLSTEPGSHTHWGQMLFPLGPLPMSLHDRLRVSLRLKVDPERAYSSWSWQANLLREGEVVASSAHDTDLVWSTGS